MDPVKLAVLELSKQDSNLLTAEGTLQYVFEKLVEVDTPMSMHFLQLLKSKIEERRNKDLVSTLLFLQHGSYPTSNQFFSYTSKNTIKSKVIVLMNRLYPVNSDEPGSDLESNKDAEAELTNQEDDIDE